MKTKRKKFIVDTRDNQKQQYSKKSRRGTKSLSLKKKMKTRMSGLMSSLSSNMEKKQMEGHFIFSDNNECLEFIIDRILYCTINYLMHMSSSSTELLRVSCEGMHGWQTFVLRLTSIYSLFSSCDLGMLSSTVSLASPKSSSKPVLVYIVLRFF